MSCTHESLELQYTADAKENGILFVYLCAPCGYYLETAMPALEVVL
jgi:hypothetical protein